MYTDKEYFLTKISSDDLNNLIGESEDNLDSAIAGADGLIDLKLAAHLTTAQLAKLKEISTPEFIKQWSYDIAMYNLHDRIQFVDIPERIEKKYNTTVTELNDLTYEALKNMLPDVFTESTDGDGIQYSSNTNRMGRDSL